MKKKKVGIAMKSGKKGSVIPVKLVMTADGITVRKLYFSGPDTKCGHPFQSYFPKRIKEGICGKCRRHSVPENQIGLFGGMGEAVKQMFKRKEATV